ncbi:Protein HGH1 homolog [Octopus vulgaris]|nr:protein HGH1 homolog isoform X1 [Octopus sinensis]XP_036358579.1 protein HGH1 homolog isoform X2 [Octopus sinensis]CAI9715461.1 Protein HGH1 homolog [Octopus vulgaris]
MADIDEKELNSLVLPCLLPAATLEVKKMALDVAVSYSEHEVGKKVLSKSETLKYFMMLTAESDCAVSKQAFTILINILADTDIAEKFLEIQEAKAFGLEAFDKITDREFESADMMCMLLSNVSRTEQCAAIITKWFPEDKINGIVEKIVSALVELNYNKKGCYLHHLSLVLCNLSQVSQIRAILLDKERRLITKLISFLSFEKSTIRRKGCAGVIKNCCFDTSCHDWLLSDVVDILPYLLLPLAGPEEFDDEDNASLPLDLQYLSPDKTRETDPETRRTLIDAVFQLCATKAGRTYIKEKNTYIIMRELHKWETDKANDIAIQNLIDILIGDEPAKEHEDLSNVVVPENLKKQFLKEDEEDLKMISDDS